MILDESGRVWIADFGLAKAVQDNELTRSGDLVGTIAYVAPERFHGSTSTSSDLYSLGVTLHEMLTLQKAFTGEDRVEVLHQVANHGLTQPRKLNPAVPRDLETIVMKAAASDPSDRYASAQALADDLEAYLQDRPIAARRVSYVEHGLRWCRRNKLLTAMACSVLLLVATVIGLLASGYQHALEHRALAERSADRAMGVVEEIYNHFAPPSLLSTTIDDGFEDELGETTSMEAAPISKSTAVLLENLLEYYDELAAESTDSEAAALKTVSANRRVGDLHQRLDQLDDAKFSYNRAIERIEQLPETLRNTEAMRLEAARIYNGLGLAAQWHSSRERTEAHRNAVHSLDEKSESPDERFELATSLYLLACAKTDRARRRSRNDRKQEQDEALAHLEVARSILTHLQSSAPYNAEHELLLARCLLREAEVNERRPRNDEGIEILNRLVQEHPDNPDFQFELGDAYVHHVDFGQVQEEELAETEEGLRHALAVTANLEVDHPNIPAYYRVKKNLHESLGRVLRDSGSLVEAEKHYERAVRLQRLLIAHAGNPEIHKWWLYRLQRDYSSLLQDAGKLERSKAILLDTSELVCELIEEQSDRSSRSSRSHRRRDEAKHRLASIYRSLSKIETQLGNEEMATEWMDKADELAR